MKCISVIAVATCISGAYLRLASASPINTHLAAPTSISDAPLIPGSPPARSYSPDNNSNQNEETINSVATNQYQKDITGMSLAHRRSIGRRQVAREKRAVNKYRELFGRKKKLQVYLDMFPGTQETLEDLKRQFTQVEEIPEGTMSSQEARLWQKYFNTLP